MDAERSDPPELLRCAACGADQIRKLAPVEHDPPGAQEVAAGGPRVSPPALRNINKSINCVAVFGVVGIAWHILWAAAAIFLIVAIVDASWNTTEWPKRYAAWAESYVCDACGFVGPPVAAERSET